MDHFGILHDKLTSDQNAGLVDPAVSAGTRPNYDLCLRCEESIAPSKRCME